MILDAVRLLPSGTILPSDRPTPFFTFRRRSKMLILLSVCIKYVVF